MVRFGFPYRVHGLTEHRYGAELLVHVEHPLLIEVFQRALIGLDVQIATTPEPPYSNSPGVFEWNQMHRDRENYVEMIEWLKNLRP